MADDSQGSTRFSLRRWSQRKLAAGRGGDTPQPDDPGRAGQAPATNVAIASPARVPEGNATAPGAARPAASPATLPERQAGRAGAIPLPPLESLTIDSDFSPFMQPGVDEAVKRSALRTLLRHPRFNVMDGLDVYIDDYSKPSPLEPELARALMQARYIFDPPKTRVATDGTVEDVPESESSPAVAGGGVEQMLEAGAGEASVSAIAQAPGADDAESRVVAAVSSTDEAKP